MVIKDLFTKLIKDPKTRKDIESMISGKGKILQEEGFDEKGKAYEKYTPLIAQTELDIKNFSKFNTSNMQKNIADSLYKYYKQKQKEIYKKYVKSIMSATDFYNTQLDDMYGEGFSSTFISLKEKEEAYIKMKSLIDSNNMQGGKETERINKIRNSAGYDANKKKSEDIIKEIKALRQMKMRQQHHKVSLDSSEFDVGKLKDNFVDLIEQNEIIIDQIQEVREQNKITIATMIDDSLADLEEIRTTVSDKSKIKGKSEISSKILDKMEKLDKAKDAFDLDEMLKGTNEVISLLDAITKKSEETITGSDSTLLQIKKKKETLDKMPATRKKTREKLANSIAEDELRFSSLPKKQQDAMKAELEVYEIIKKNTEALRSKLLTKELSTTNITQQYNTGKGTEDIDIVKINQGSLVGAVDNIKNQQSEDVVEENAKKLEEMKSKIIDSQKSSEYESQVNSMNNQMGKLEGTILKPGEYMEQMAREFGSYMLRVRMVQRGIQDIVGAIGEFQKIDDQAFQLGMVSDLNVGSIRNYRNEVLGLATDYRTTAEEILSAESEVIKSGRTFEQAKQQISASLILSRATFEDLNSASDTLNKLMLTLEMSGNKSYETMSKLYNVVQNTPASLAGMEASMRQSSAAFSGLLDNIDFSGGQLEDYQGKLRDAELALVGFVNLQGKTPQMAGTAVKTLVDKMRSPTDKAKVQINSELARTGATYEGSQVTSDTISRLTETDFPQAIDLLSKLYINGNLTYQAIQDMFGPRNAATLSKLLYQVGGDLDKNSDTMLNKLDPIRDSEKLTKSWSEEMEELKNSFRALKGVANDFGDALLPVIAVTGDMVAGIAEFASGSGAMNQGVKAGLQVGAAGYTVGKIGTNAMLAMYSMNQTDMSEVAEGQEGMFVIGKLFKSIGSSAGGASLSLASLNTAIRSFASGATGAINGMIKFVTSGIGIALLAVTAIMTALYTMYRVSQDNLSKTNQNAIDAGKAFEAREQALQAENDILKSLTKTMESLNPAAFKTSESVSLLTQEIKNMLDMTIDYTEKLSAFTKKSWADKLIKEQEDIINNNDTKPDARATAEKKKAYLNKIKEGNETEPDDKKIADMKRKSEIYKVLSDTEHATRADLINLGVISEKDASRLSDKELSRDFQHKYNNQSKDRGIGSIAAINAYYGIVDGSLPAFSPVNLTQDIKDAENNSGALNGNMKEASEEFKIQAEVWQAYQQAKSDNLESINSAIAKEVKGVQDVNNYINSLIIEKQKSIFNESGDYLNGKEKLAFMSKDADLRKAISETPDLLNKISDITSKDAFEYVQKVALIKKQSDKINESLSAYSDLIEDKKDNLIGSNRELSADVNKIVDIKSKKGERFEEATGITSKELRGVLKDTTDKNKILSQLKKMAILNGKEIDETMTNGLIEYIKTMDVKGFITASNYFKVSAKNVKVSDVFNKNGEVIPALQNRLSILEEIYIKTADEELAKRIEAYFVKINHATLKDILGARADYKEKEVIPIITATNEMDRAMNALILASQNKLLTISAQLNNATIKMNNMGTGDYIKNAEDEKKLRIEQWRQDLANEYIGSAANGPKNIDAEDKNRISKIAIEIFKNSDKTNNSDKRFLEKMYAGGSDIGWTDEDKAKYEIWQKNPKMVDTRKNWEAEHAKQAVIYQGTSEYTNKINNKAVSRANEMATIVKPYVEKTGRIDTDGLKRRFGKNIAEYNKAITAAQGLADIMKSSYDSLNISKTAVDASKKADKRAEEDNDIEIKYANGLSGAQGSTVSTFKSLDQRKAGLGRDLADRYEYLQKNSYAKHLGKVTGADTYGEAVDEIMNLKDTSDTEKSKLKEYAETYFATLREGSKVQNEFIEQFRKLKNELITDVFNINQFTGEGKTSGSSTEIKTDIDDYYSNLIKISKAQLEVNSAISAGVKVSVNEKGESSVVTGNAPDMEARVSDNIKAISNLAKANENILPRISAFVTDMNKSVSGEFDVEKLAREIASFDASAVISKTPKSEAEQQKNDKIYEQRIKTKNLYLQSYNDILAPLSSFPNIQEEISKNQIQILENMKAELVARDKVLKRSTDVVEIKKLEVQILSAQLEKQKQITQKRISAFEEEKKYLSLRRENATILGKVNDNSPAKNLEENMKFAKEQLMISLEQIRIEEEARRVALAQIGSMDSLKGSIDTLISKLSTPDYTPEGAARGSEVSTKSYPKLSKSFLELSKMSNEKSKSFNETSKDSNSKFVPKITTSLQSMTKSFMESLITDNVNNQPQKEEATKDKIEEQDNTLESLKVPSSIITDTITASKLIITAPNTTEPQKTETTTSDPDKILKDSSKDEFVLKIHTPEYISKKYGFANKENKNPQKTADGILGDTKGLSNSSTDSTTPNPTSTIQDVADKEDKSIVENYKQRIAFEEYINTVYKARVEYANQMDAKYGKTIDNIQALIGGFSSGNLPSIKAEPVSLRKSIQEFNELRAFTKKGSIEEVAGVKMEGFFKNYTGDDKMLEPLIGKDNVEKFVGDAKNAKNLAILKDKDPTVDKTKAISELEKALGRKTKDNETKITHDKKVSTYANLIASTVAQISSVYDSILNSKLASQMEGLQAEEKVLNARKAGYRTELAKQQIDKQIYQNKLSQIETQQKIDQANAGSAVGGVMSGIGVGLMATNPIAGAIVQVASPFIAQAVGALDSDAHMKAEQAKADLMTEKNYKEYNDFWNLFFSTIKNITAMASQNIDNLSKDYSSGRNLGRLNYGIQNQEDINTSIIDSLNDFQGLGSVDEQYQTRKYFKKKTKHVVTGMNYAFDNLSLDDMKKLAGMDSKTLKDAMILELKKDNGAYQMATANEQNAGEKVFGSGANHPLNYLGNVLSLFGGSKFEGATWNVLDSDVTDFQESLKEAIGVIEYLSREMNSLADKIYYADKEGYGSTSQEDTSAKYTELIANAKTAGNTTLATALQGKYDAEMQKFKDANGGKGASELYYSTFSSIIMESAKKVAKDTGKFSDAYASGIGAAFGAQFGNIITEAMNRAVPDNSKIDDYMLDFSEKLKTYTGDMSSFINDGVLDMEGVSQAIGAESFFGKLTETAKSLTTMESINMYRTSKDVATELRGKGLSENQIATFLESASLKDTLKSAVEKISDVFNPVGMSSAELVMQRESFDADNSDRMEELRRKKLIGGTRFSDANKIELEGLEAKDMKLSIKENVVAGFESGIKSALTKDKYSDIFAEFGSTIGNSIKDAITSKLDYSALTTEIGNLIADGDIEGASSKMSVMSLSLLKDRNKMKETVNALRASGKDWTEIESFGLSSNEYSAIEDILKGNDSLKQSIAKYEKELYNYNNKMATDKYTSEEYYAELTKRIVRNETLADSEQEWYEEYEAGLNRVIEKQSLLNSLAGNLNGILSNSSGLAFLKTIGASIGESLNGIIVKSLKADGIMQSLVEKMSNGDDTSKEISALSSLYSYAKYKQEAMRKSMIKNGSSYSFVESVFGENASSKVADVYMEMKRYSDLLGEITKEESNYKESLLSLNGLTFTYEEYYRELALRKANNIALTEQEVAWMDKYSESINSFQINSSIVTDFYSALTSSFGKTTNQEIFDEFANGFIETIRAKIVDGYLGGELSEDMASAISLAQEAASTGTVSDLYNAQQKLIQLSSQIQVAKQQSQGLIDMFDSKKLVDFTDKTKDIQYSASSSKDITYNITQNLTLSAGSVIGDGVSLEKLAKVLAPMLKPEIAKIK